MLQQRELDAEEGLFKHNFRSIRSGKYYITTYREGDDERIPPPERRGIVYEVNFDVYREMYENNRKALIIYR
jgi:hypothetical protein